MPAHSWRSSLEFLRNVASNRGVCDSSYLGALRLSEAELGIALEQKDRPTLRRVFGTPSLVAFGLAYLVPLTVFTTFGTVSRITEGHLPAAYLITTVAMLFTALSYASLVRELPSAGSAYAFASKAFGAGIGFLAGWTLLLDYLLLPAINYLIIGIYMHAAVPEVPAWIFVLAGIALVTALNIVGADVVRNVSLALVGFQLLFAATFIARAVHVSESFPSAPFYSAEMPWSGLFAGAGILCLSFLGFDAVSTLSEEAGDPRRTVPRAILITTLAGGAIFILLSYASSLLLPDWAATIGHDSAGMEVMTPLGPFIATFFLVAYISGCIASAITAQASVSRVLYAMGREATLPRRWFGQLSGRFRTPVRATVTVAGASLFVLLVSLDTIASMISFGALAGFSVVNLAVPTICLRAPASRTPLRILLYGLCPLSGFAMTLWLWLSLNATALLAGFIWIGIGMCWVILRRVGRTDLDVASLTSTN